MKMNLVNVIVAIFISMLAIAVFLPGTTQAGCTCDAYCRGAGHRSGHMW